MNKNGQLQGIGALVMTAIAIIVGLVILTGGITDPVGTTTQTAVAVNQTFTAAAVNGTITLNGQAVQGTLFIANRTSGAQVPNSNFTLTNYVTVNGALVPTLKTLDSSAFAGQPINLSYTYEPQGYVTDAGSRSIIGLIIILCAIAIAVVALAPTLRNGVINLFGM